MSQPVDVAEVSLTPLKDRRSPSGKGDFDEDSSVQAREASPAEIEDAVFGQVNEDGPNYKNVSRYSLGRETLLYLMAISLHTYSWDGWELPY
jgi:hypothetical protein